MAYDVGTVTEGTVVEIAKFGAFVKLVGGKTGLVHISEISDKFVQEVADYVAIGSSVIVKIISIDDKKRIQLSMKAVAKEEAEKYGAEQTERQEERTRRQYERPAHAPSAPRGGSGGYSHDNGPEDTFEKKLRGFMRQSEDRLVDVKRNLESKRGARRKKK